jgi:hypothetical protein
MFTVSKPLTDRISATAFSDAPERCASFSYTDTDRTKQLHRKHCNSLGVDTDRHPSCGFILCALVYSQLASTHISPTVMFRAVCYCPHLLWAGTGQFLRERDNENFITARAIHAGSISHVFVHKTVVTPRLPPPGTSCPFRLYSLMLTGRRPAFIRKDIRDVTLSVKTIV